jgi:hypothetical protein
VIKDEPLFSKSVNTYLAVTIPVDTFVTRYNNNFIFVHKKLVGRSANRTDHTETSGILNSHSGVAARFSGI